MICGHMYSLEYQEGIRGRIGGDSSAIRQLEVNLSMVSF